MMIYYSKKLNTNLASKGTGNKTMKLDAFTLAYIECALWSSSDESTENGGDPLDQNYTIDDIAPEALARITADCAAFQAANAADLQGIDAGRAGHDFWLTRNGHGAGFWDRDLGDAGERLTEASDKFGMCNLYVGDDGRLYIA